MELIDEILSSAPVWFGKNKANKDETYNRYTNYAVDLLDFLNRKPSDYGGILQHLESLAELLENYAIAKAYDKSEDVRRAVDIIEGDVRVPRDVRDLMRRIKDSETREMLYDLVDSVILNLWRSSVKEKNWKKLQNA